VHTNPSADEPEIRPVPDAIIDQWIEAAAGVLTSSGQPHFMDIDLARITAQEDGAPDISSTQFSASLVRLCEQGILTPFVAPIIIRTLLRGAHRIRPRPSSPAGQILTAVDDDGFITASRLIQLVKRRNSLITFLADDEHLF